MVELVKGGADTSVRDKHSRQPIHYAAAHGHTDVVEFLASRGADTDADDGRGRTPLHYTALGGYMFVYRMFL